MIKWEKKVVIILFLMVGKLFFIFLFNNVRCKRIYVDRNIFFIFYKNY